MRESCSWNDITSLKKGPDVPLILCSVVLRSICVIVCVIVFFFCVNHSMCESAIGFMIRGVGAQAGPTHKNGTWSDRWRSATAG